MPKDEYYRRSRGYWHDVPAPTGRECDIEVLAEAVHQAYLDTCARLGWPVKPSNQVPYAKLSEDSKELDRASVRAVLAGANTQSHQSATRSEGVELIAAERRRQIEVEGWTPEHDAQHSHCELMLAAVMYAYAAEATQYGRNNVTFNGGFRVGEGVPSEWPWAPEWWKPSDDPVRNLVKAGALIAAEVDRLLERDRNPHYEDTRRQNRD